MRSDRKVKLVYLWFWVKYNLVSCNVSRVWGFNSVFTVCFLLIVRASLWFLFCSVWLVLIIGSPPPRLGVTMETDVVIITLSAQKPSAREEEEEEEEMVADSAAVNELITHLSTILTLSLLWFKHEASSRQTLTVYCVSYFYTFVKKLPVVIMCYCVLNWLLKSRKRDLSQSDTNQNYIYFVQWSGLN